MIAQRGETRTESKTRKKTRTGKAKAASAPSTRVKLSFNDKYALENLPGQMDALNHQISEHEKTLEDANLFAQSPDTFQAAVDGLRAAQEELARLEDQWLELEMKREELEGA